MYEPFPPAGNDYPDSLNDAHSHSIVPGGLPVMSYVTLLIPRTSLMIRAATRPRNACPNG